ncbi:uncharacterized protein LOC143447421 [Clavelina lepadiformis]|uniref:uncharacterized protein LOC143447421 n=1 Tax=Clavelina lepadiformis TaxID=159417 RepID=UPI00404114E4
MNVVPEAIFFLLLHVKTSLCEPDLWFYNRHMTTQATTTTNAPPYSWPTTEQNEKQEQSFSLFDRFRPKQIAQPLTTQLCGKRIYQSLRTCKMLSNRKQSKQLMRRSKQYLCSYKDRFLMTDVENYLSSSTSYSHNHSIQKKAVNHCSGHQTRKVILQAYEADRPYILRDLLHDPINHLYQTMFIENCYELGPFGGFKCRMHPIKFKAAVWSIDETSDEIEVVNVITDGYCALST